ncbi:hypothetical protein [Kibdelosporangium aridum]|uniref:hypothetical protein n=1 Tax=Kibdelosporangium aridum TaxID=2030 RepID=UPI00117BA802|nr:hypothetical protein [Kibdelosporangium aridum]
MIATVGAWFTTTTRILSVAVTPSGNTAVAVTSWAPGGNAAEIGFPVPSTAPFPRRHVMVGVPRPSS